MTQLLNVPMQPKPTNATERLTLIEKLELEKECWHDDGENNVHRIIDDCIDIVKQHQGESGWISADERLPDKDGKYLVYCVGNRELTKDRKELSIMRFNQKTKGGWFALSPLFKVVYWQPIQPPSEVQDETV